MRTNMKTAYCTCNKGKYITEYEKDCFRPMVPTLSNSDDECIYCGYYVQYRSDKLLYPRAYDGVYERISNCDIVWSKHFGNMIAWEIYKENTLGGIF